MQQLSALDAMFAYTETNTTPMHIGGLVIYDPSTAPGGKVRFKDILHYVEGRLDGARIFRQKMVRVPLDLDHPYWVEDEDFDLEYHVRHIALPKPGDWRQLCIQAARIYSRPLDMNKPLWEFTVVEGLDHVKSVPKGSFAVVQKYHHAAVDGQSGLQMGLALHDTDAEMKPRKFKMDWKPEADPSPLSLLAKVPFNYIANPFRSTEVLKNLLPAPAKLFNVQRNFQQREDAKTNIPRTRFNTKIGPHRVFDGHLFPLEDVKKIRKAFPGATVNDVMLAVVSGSMRSYLLDKNELPEQTLKFGAPISVRTKDQRDDAGNQVSIMTIGAGTHLSDSGERMEFILSETQRSKAMSEAIGAKTLMELSNAIPAGLTAAGTKMFLQMGLVDTVAPPMNTVITNVPGPMEKLYFAGAELVSTYGMGILAEGQGIFHIVSSYHGNVILSFLADRDIMSDPDVYTEAISRSFADLAAAAAKRMPKTAKPASKEKGLRAL